MKFKQIVLTGLLIGSTAVLADDGFVAGLKPDERPAGAPVISTFQPTEARQAMALKGIAEPRNGVGFVKDQGAWYTPFDRPNLPDRYDIRGMHSNDNKKKD